VQTVSQRFDGRQRARRENRRRPIERKGAKNRIELNRCTGGRPGIALSSVGTTIWSRPAIGRSACTPASHRTASSPAAYSSTRRTTAHRSACNAAADRDWNAHTH
jgi:hypothetical protein